LNRSTVISIVGVGAVALLIGVALGSVAFPRVSTETTFQSTTVTKAETTTMFYGDATVISVPYGNLPENFVVGNYLFNTTEYAPLPAITRNGTITSFAAGVLLIFNVSSMKGSNQQFEQANFTWLGTFSEKVPSPSNATLLGGDVHLVWYVSSSLLYLVIATNVSS